MCSSFEYPNLYTTRHNSLAMYSAGGAARIIRDIETTENFSNWGECLYLWNDSAIVHIGSSHVFVSVALEAIEYMQPFKTVLYFQRRFSAQTLHFFSTYHISRNRFKSMLYPRSQHLPIFPCFKKTHSEKRGIHITFLL